MYICLLPQFQLLCQLAAIITMQICHMAIHIPNLIRIERGIDWNPGPQIRKFLLSYRKPLYIDVYLSAAFNPAFVLASRYNYNAARPDSNTHTKFDYDWKRFRMAARTSYFKNFYFLIEIHCTSMYICLPQNQLLRQQVAIITLQPGHISVHKLSLIMIERGLGWEPRSRAGPYSNTHTMLY